MGRYTGPVCKLCRREGVKLFLKGERCFTDKCAIERRGYAPGMHGRFGRRRRSVSDYAKQLREKQKTKRMYGLMEKQFRNYFKKAASQRGVTGERLLVALETRLDNVVYRLGFASSRKSARQLVRHRHVEVNGRVLDIPSYQIQPGEEIRIREKAQEMPLVLGAIERRGKERLLPWLSVDYKSMTGKVLAEPTRVEIPTPVEEQMIVELYSK